MTILRDFIFGTNTTGLVVPSLSGAGASVDGGALAALAVDAVRGQSGIFVGSVQTTGTVFYPAATVAAWDAFIATATATVLPGVARDAQTGGALGVRSAGVGIGAVVAAMVAGVLVGWA